MAYVLKIIIRLIYFTVKPPGGAEHGRAIAVEQTGNRVTMKSWARR